MLSFVRYAILKCCFQLQHIQCANGDLHGINNLKCKVHQQCRDCTTFLLETALSLNHRPSPSTSSFSTSLLARNQHECKRKCSTAQHSATDRLKNGPGVATVSYAVSIIAAASCEESMPSTGIHLTYKKHKVCMFMQGALPPQLLYGCVSHRGSIIEQTHFLKFEKYTDAPNKRTLGSQHLSACIYKSNVITSAAVPSRGLGI